MYKRGKREESGGFKVEGRSEALYLHLTIISHDYPRSPQRSQRSLKD